MSRRKLAPDEIDLWTKVAKTTERLAERETFDPEAYAPQPAARRVEPKPQVTLDGRTPPKPPARKITYDLTPSLPDQLTAAPVQMDRKTFGKIKR